LLLLENTKIEKDTILKAKVTCDPTADPHDHSISFGLRHNFKDFINFGFIGKFNYDKVNEVKTLKQKFGLIFEINDI